jgi:threonyl-tRNA synthetase
LAPEQIRIVPVADKFVNYADNVYNKLKDKWIRVVVDDSADSFSKKIRNAELMKVPYIVIVWEKEESDWTVSIRVYKTKEQLTINVDEFVDEKVRENEERSL